MRKKEQREVRQWATASLSEFSRLLSGQDAAARAELLAAGVGCGAIDSLYPLTAESLFADLYQWLSQPGEADQFYEGWNPHTAWNAAVMSIPEELSKSALKVHQNLRDRALTEFCARVRTSEAEDEYAPRERLMKELLNYVGGGFFFLEAEQHYPFSGMRWGNHTIGEHGRYLQGMRHNIDSAIKLLQEVRGEGS